MRHRWDTLDGTALALADERARKDMCAPLVLVRHTDAALCACGTGRTLYASERERMYGQKKRRTERLAARAARRSRTLALAYSASVAASYLILVFNAAAALPHS